MRILLVLSTFSKEEFKDFGRFLRSPIYNTNTTIIKFYEYLKPHFPAFENMDLYSEKVFHKIFARKDYNNGVMRNLISDFLKLSEEYMAYLRFNNNGLMKDVCLLKELDTRRLDKLFNKAAEKFSSKISSSPVQDEDYFLNKHFLESIKREFSESRVLPGKSSPVFENIPEEINSLINFFIIKIFKEYFKILNVQRQLKFNFEEEIFEFMLKYTEANREELEKVFVIKLLYKFLQLSKDKNNDRLYTEIKTLLSFNEKAVGPEYCKVFYTELYNYCKRRQASGERSFGRESFELIKKILKIKTAPGEEAYLSAHSYINIISTAIREGELAWAESFAENYRKAVIPQQSMNAYFYSLALISFSRGRQAGERKKYYEKALEYLLEVRTEDFYYQARTKNLSLRIYYELDEFDTVLSIIDSYRHFLSNNKSMPEPLNKRYRQFVYFLNKLVKVKISSKSDMLWNFNKELQKREGVEYKEWLIAKAQEIEEGK